jgi:hypothetical protein
VTAAEKRVLAALFDMLAERMSSAGCNDFDLAELMPRVAERRAFMKRAFELSESMDGFDADDTFEVVDDQMVLDVIADKLGLDVNPEDQ